MQDNHSVPIAYLKQWAPRGELCEIRRLDDGMTVRRTSPEAAGFTPRLYEIADTPAEIAADLAARFAAAAPADVAETLQHVISTERSQWDAASRERWIAFLLTLMFRSPRTVAQVRAAVHEILDVSARRLRARYAAKRSDPKAFAEYVLHGHADAPEKTATAYLEKVMDGEATARLLNAMRWARIAVPNSRFSLLTSDDPLDIPLSLHHQNAYLALPLTPDCVFVASNNAGLLDSLAKQDHSKIVRMMNMATVTHAHEYVWCVDESQSAFVKNHFGAAPEQRLLPDTARQAALQIGSGSL